MVNNDQIGLFDANQWAKQFKDLYNSYRAIDICLNPSHVDYNCLENMYIEEDVDNALSHYSKHLIISFCTYFEVMIKEFFYTIFCEKPQKMEKFLPSEFSGKFNELLLNNCLDPDSIEIFASITTKKIFNFQINKTINAICDVSKLKGYEANTCKDEFSETKKHLTNIFKLRNKLIHENTPPKNEINKIIDTIYSIIAPNFINQLDKVCVELKISTVINRKEKEEELSRLLENMW